MRKLTALLFFLCCSSLTAQENGQPSYALSLEEAINLGLENNYSARSSQLEVEKAIKQKWEIISQGLPQIDANVDYQNYLQQPVTLLPAAAFDNTQSTINIVESYFENVQRNNVPVDAPDGFIPVRFGTRQSLNGTATWNQLIFDGSYIVGIQSARTLLQISKNAKTKTNQEVKKTIINAYGNVLLAEESVEILTRNVENVEKNFLETREIFRSGMAEEEDVEQLEITLLGLQNNLNRSIRMRSISYEMLNLALGVPVEAKVVLTESLNALSLKYFDPAILENVIPVEENIDYRIAENSAEAAHIQVRLEQAKALPRLTGFLNLGATGYGNEFNFFNEEQEYFTQSILGLSLNIPIFSSGMRSSRTQQRKIEHEQALLDLEQTENQVKMEINSAKNEYEFSLENLKTQRRNLELAERIENKNQIKFSEGLASSFELNEARTQLYAAQQNYLQAMLNVINAKADLETLLDTSRYEN